jgi:DNA modification methylase
MELNTVHNMDNRVGLPLLPEKCANLIISDPPYFEVKGDFDFVWSSFEEYLAFMNQQAEMYKRILADNGTLLVYGHAKRIAYVQVIFDKYFNLENNLTWNKAERDGLFGSSGSDLLRSFPPCTERILMYSNEVVSVNGLSVLNVRNYIRSEIIRAKGAIVLKEVNKALGTATNGGGVASAILSLDKTEPGMLTEENYFKLRNWLNESDNVNFLAKDYDDLKREFDDLRRPFNNICGLTEVLNFRFHPSEYDHETVKPEKLTRSLILTCSRKNDLVVVPFAGSGTECAMSLKEGRRFIGFEISEKFTNMANKRCQQQLAKKELFN